jgi:hypothetical protein
MQSRVSELFESPCCVCVFVLVNSPRLNREISRFLGGKPRALPSWNKKMKKSTIYYQDSCLVKMS